MKGTIVKFRTLSPESTRLILTVANIAKKDVANLDKVLRREVAEFDSGLQREAKLSGAYQKAFTKRRAELSFFFAFIHLLNEAEEKDGLKKAVQKLAELFIALAENAELTNRFLIKEGLRNGLVVLENSEIALLVDYQTQKKGKSKC